MDSNDSDGAIREGEPPVIPSSRPVSQEDAARCSRESPSSLCSIAFGIGFFLATGALLAAAATAISFSTAKPLFVFGLLLAFSASVFELNSAHLWGLAGILIVVLLIVLSFLPVYIEHVGTPDNPRSHRHMLWWPDHVH
jgi:hypothetical protein